MSAVRFCLWPPMLMLGEKQPRQDAEPGPPRPTGFRRLEARRSIARADKANGALEALAAFDGVDMRVPASHGRNPPTAQGHHLGFENPARAKLAAKMRRSECQGAQATRIGAAAWRASAD